MPSSKSSSELVASCKALMSNSDNLKTLLQGDEAARKDLLAKHNLGDVDAQELRDALTSAVRGHGNAPGDNDWMVNAALTWIVH
jgi:hypothetical protein